VTSGQKTAVSLLTTVVIFACFTVAAFAGLFSQIEARFYEPAKVAGIRKQLDQVSDSSETYIQTLLDRFGTGAASFVRNGAVASYLSPEPADTDVRMRTKITGTLFSDTPGLDGIRLVDSNGRNVHFSTYSSDILRQTDTLRMYRNYDELKTPSGEPEFPFESVSAPDSLTGGAEKYRITYDGAGGRIIFAFPFYDSYSAYRGTMLFYVNASDLNRTLVMQNLVSINDTCVLVAAADGSQGGYVFGMPNIGRTILEPAVLSEWQKHSPGPDKIVNVSAGASDSGDSGWIFISGRENQFLPVSGVYRSSVFIMPQAVQILLLVCVFITLFLTVFMILCLRHDDMVVIRDRIKRLQFALINEYLENKETVDWNDVSRNVAGRRREVSEEIKKSLGRRAKRHEEETDRLISRSWDEIITALDSRSGTALPVPDGSRTQSSLQDQQEIRRMLEEILRSGSVKAEALSAPLQDRKAAVPAASAGTEELEPADDVLEALPEADGAEADELEEIPEAEPAESAEETAAESGLEPADGVLEALPEGDGAEADELEEIPEAEPAESAEEAAAESGLEPADGALEALPEADSDNGISDVSEKVSESSVSIDEFITEENSRDTVPVPEFLAEPLRFGEPERIVFHPQEEDAAVAGFTAAPVPGFSHLDGGSALSVSGEGRADDRSPEENVSLDTFGVTDADTDSEFLHETPGFSYAAGSENAAGASVPDFELEPEMPDFVGLDESVVSDESADTVDTAIPDDVSPLAGEKDATPFVFTRFGANNDNVYELTPLPGDVIVEDKNGLFSISPDFAYSGIVQDPMFKKLVDSVLH